MQEVFRIALKSHPAHGRLYVRHVALEAGVGDVIAPSGISGRIEFGGSVLGLAVQAMGTQGAVDGFGIK